MDGSVVVCRSVDRSSSVAHHQASYRWLGGVACGIAVLIAVCDRFVRRRYHSRAPRSIPYRDALDDRNRLLVVQQINLEAVNSPGLLGHLRRFRPRKVLLDLDEVVGVFSKRAVTVNGQAKVPGRSLLDYLAFFRLPLFVRASFIQNDSPSVTPLFAKARD